MDYVNKDLAEVQRLLEQIAQYSDQHFVSAVGKLATRALDILAAIERGT